MLGLVGGIASTIGSLVSAFTDKQESQQDGFNINKEDFLKLMTAQMQSQNPLQPFDSNTLMKQISDLSSLTSNQQLTSTLNNLSANMIYNQAQQATQMVGREVMVPGNQGSLVEGQPFKGAIVSDKAASDIVIKITDQSGNLVKTIQLGTADKGTTTFTWDGVGDNGQQAPAGTYNVSVTGSVDGATVPLSTATVGKVESVSFSQEGVMLTIPGLGAVAMNNIISIL